MSIAGAVGLGVAISGIIIKFQKSVYDEKISVLQGYATELDNHLNILKGYKGAIPGFWNDETGKDFERVIDEQINQLTVARQRVEDLSHLYDNLKSTLDKSRNVVKEKVDEITGIVGALTGLSQ